MSNNVHGNNADQEYTQYGDFGTNSKHGADPEATDFSGFSSEETQFSDNSEATQFSDNSEATQFSDNSEATQFSDNSEATQLGGVNDESTQLGENPFKPSTPKKPIASSWMPEKGKTVIKSAGNFPGEKKKINWKKVTQGGVTGIALGSAAVLLTSLASGDEVLEDPEPDGELVLEVHPEGTSGAGDSSLASLVDSDVAWATGVTDDMSYAEAFAAARAEVGPGGVFEWRGQLYGTYYGDEWDNMSPAERDEFNNHFAWTGGDSHSGGDSHPSVSDEVEVLSGDELAELEDDSRPTASDEVSPTTEEEVDVIDDTLVDPVDVAETDDLVNPDEPEVEVLGSYYDEETGMTYGGMTIDGEEVLLIDVESDGEFDYAVIDSNHNGTIDEGELIELTEPAEAPSSEPISETTTEPEVEDYPVDDDYAAGMIDDFEVDPADDVLDFDDI